MFFQIARENILLLVNNIHENIKLSAVFVFHFGIEALDRNIELHRRNILYFTLDFLFNALSAHTQPKNGTFIGIFIFELFSFFEQASLSCCLSREKIY